MDFLYMIIAAVPEGYDNWLEKWPVVHDKLRQLGTDCTVMDAYGVTAEWGIESSRVILTDSYKAASAIADLFHDTYEQDVVIIIRIPATVTFHTKGDS